MKQEQKVNILGVTGFVIRHIKLTIDQERATGILNPTAKKLPDKYIRVCKHFKVHNLVKKSALAYSF